MPSNKLNMMNMISFGIKSFLLTDLTFRFIFLKHFMPNFTPVLRVIKLF